jgi:chemotaxis protein MotB
MFRSPSRVLLFAVVLMVTAPGCVVRRGTYDVALTAIARAEAEQDSLQRQMEEERAAAAAREEALGQQIQARDARIEALLQRVDDLDEALARTQASLTGSSTEVDRLRQVLQEYGTQSLDLRQRLDALAEVERETRERNRVYEDVLGRFQSLIDGGRLSVSIRDGRMVIRLPQDILFPSGSATLAADGTATLREVGTVLAEISERRFQVEGHTDNVPIATERFPSNWELSSARAMSVVHVLLDRGVTPANISGAGYGEHRPVAPNDTPVNRRLNRRIEIVMLPNLDVIAESELP